MKRSKQIRPSALCAALAVALAAPSLHADIDPTLIDGMTPSEWADVDTLYTRGEVDLTAYRSVLIEPPTVEMRDRWLRQQNRQRLSPQERIRPEDEEKIKEELSADLVGRFTDVLNRAGFEVVEEAGPDTLTLKPALVKVDVFDPNLSYRQSARRAPATSAQLNTAMLAGEMTLQMQLVDGASGNTLAVAEDKLQARKVTSNIGNDITDREANAVILDRWAAKLVRALNGAES